MKLQVNQEFRNLGPAPLIYYQPGITVNKKPEDKSASLKVKINTQPGEAKSESISLYVPIFKKGSPEGILKLRTLIEKIIKGQSLNTSSKMYTINKNLLAV